MWTLKDRQIWNGDKVVELCSGSVDYRCIEERQRFVLFLDRTIAGSTVVMESDLRRWDRSASRSSVVEAKQRREILDEILDALDAASFPIEIVSHRPERPDTDPLASPDDLAYYLRSISARLRDVGADEADGPFIASVQGMPGDFYGQSTGALL